MDAQSCGFELHALHDSDPMDLAVGQLPGNTTIHIEAGGQQWSVATDGAGVLKLAGLKSTRILLIW
jgi:hypothetical protein